MNQETQEQVLLDSSNTPRRSPSNPNQHVAFQVPLRDRMLQVWPQVKDSLPKGPELAYLDYLAPKAEDAYQQAVEEQELGTKRYGEATQEYLREKGELEGKIQAAQGEIANLEQAIADKREDLRPQVEDRLSPERDDLDRKQAQAEGSLQDARKDEQEAREQLQQVNALAPEVYAKAGLLPDPQAPSLELPAATDNQKDLAATRNGVERPARETRPAQILNLWVGFLVMLGTASVIGGSMYTVFGGKLSEEIAWFPAFLAVIISLAVTLGFGGMLYKFAYARAVREMLAFGLTALEERKDWLFHGAKIFLWVLIAGLVVALGLESLTGSQGLFKDLLYSQQVRCVLDGTCEPSSQPEAPTPMWVVFAISLLGTAALGLYRISQAQRNAEKHLSQQIIAAQLAEQENQRKQTPEVVRALELGLSTHTARNQLAQVQARIQAAETRLQQIGQARETWRTKVEQALEELLLKAAAPLLAQIERLKAHIAELKLMLEQLKATYEARVAKIQQDIQEKISSAWAAAEIFERSFEAYVRNPEQPLPAFVGTGSSGFFAARPARRGPVAWLRAWLENLLGRGKSKRKEVGI